MGKVLGIIAEYNPFHNGHLYHLEQAKKSTKSSYTVAIISGNFTQRGGCSLFDKWTKAKVALQSGIDLVIELPVLYATSSAENFADGSIKILDSLKVVDYLAFGAEIADINTLSSVSTILNDEPKEFKTLLAQELQKGLSFPKSRENAIVSYFENDKKYSKVLSAPNNILGIEYIKALKKYKSKIEPLAIERYEAGYNDLTYSGNIASATAIRNIVKNNGFNILQNLMPEATYSALIENIQNGHLIPDLSVFEKQIIYNLRMMSTEQIAELPDVSEGLEFALKNAANSCSTLVELLNIVNSKRYTLTRIQRILVYCLLGITKKDMALSKKVQPYIRVLGFNERGKYLLSEIAKANPKLEIITSVKKFMDNSLNKNLKLILDKDVFATNVYTIGYESDSWSNLDFTKKIVKI